MPRSGHLPALLAVALATAGCGPTARTPAPPVLDAAALELIDRLDENGYSISWQGDRVTEPESFGLLVRMGERALPTILHVTETTPDSFTRDLLIDVASRIGDPRARPMLERLMHSTSPNTQAEAIKAVGRLGMRESLPALRALLASLPPVDGSTRLQVLEAIYRVGHVEVLGEVLRIAFADGEHQFEAIEILLRHPPLRTALGLPQFQEGAFEPIDNETFLRAVDEWYCETVLARPSRWRPRKPDFTEPFAAEKRAAFTRLEQSVQDNNDPFSNVRVHPVDAQITATDGERTLSVLTGWGHSSALAVWVWCPEADAVHGHQFVLHGAPPRSSFPEDLGAVDYATTTIAPADYLALLASLRTALEAKLVPWWAGPEHGESFSTNSLVVSIDGVGETTTPNRFCGYMGSTNRGRYEGLRAAAAWHSQFVDERATLRATDLTAQAKQLFSERFRREQPLWANSGDSWWWVRERLVSMARDCGDDTLREPLAQLLAPKYAKGDHSMSRTAASAATALAAITGTELRFAADGTARPVAEVAAAYRELLTR